jgi:hypothetical protein
VKWTRTPLSAYFTDTSHVFGAGSYSFADFDSTQCAAVRNGITPIVEIDAGDVRYNSVPGVVSPVELPNYKTAADFGQFCGVIATHERQTFTSVTRYSIPGNEVNIDPTTWAGGEPQIVAYEEACYQAIKAVQPNAVVYGLELTMDASLNPSPATFVQQLYNLGCKVGTCYDAISIHMFPAYPFPPAGTPCLPTQGGNYDMQCVTDIQNAAHAPTMHVLIGETAYLVPSTVPNEASKATAVVAAMEQFAENPYVDGVNYGNVDECALYPSGYFMGGCLVSVQGAQLPAYGALESLATSAFR